MEIRTLNRTEVKTNETNNIPAKVIRKVSLARQILNAGGDKVRVIDLKPDRDNRERTVVIFRDDPDFQEVFSKVLEDNRRNRENPETADLKKQIEEMKKKLEALSKNTDEKE